MGRPGPQAVLSGRGLTPSRPSRVGGPLVTGGGDSAVCGLQVIGSSWTEAAASLLRAFHLGLGSPFLSHLPADLPLILSNTAQTRPQ